MLATPCNHFTTTHTQKGWSHNGDKMIVSGRKEVLRVHRPHCNQNGFKEVAPTALKKPPCEQSGRPEVGDHCFGLPEVPDLYFRHKEVSGDCGFFGRKQSQAVASNRKQSQAVASSHKQSKAIV